MDVAVDAAVDRAVGNVVVDRADNDRVVWVAVGVAVRGAVGVGVWDVGGVIKGIIEKERK